MQVVQRLLEKAKKDKVLQFRHCARFLPCTHVCRADKAAIAETAKAVAEDAFASGARLCLLSAFRMCTRAERHWPALCVWP